MVRQPTADQLPHVCGQRRHTAGAEEQLRAFDRPAGEDHLARLERLGLPGQRVADDEIQAVVMVLHVLDEVVEEQVEARRCLWRYRGEAPTG